MDANQFEAKKDVDAFQSYCLPLKLWFCCWQLSVSGIKGEKVLHGFPECLLVKIQKMLEVELCAHQLVAATVFCD